MELGSCLQPAPQPTGSKEGARGCPGETVGRQRLEEHRYPTSGAPKSSSLKNKAAISLQMQNNQRATMIYFSSPEDKLASETGLC